MPVIRTLIFAGAVYLLSSLLFVGAITLMSGTAATPSFASVVLYWVGIIVIILGGAKWYFKGVEPTTKRGFLLGCAIIVLSAVIDMLLLLGAYFLGSSLDVIRAMYAGWEVLVTVIVILVTATYAGFEFDATYSRPSSQHTKDTL